jgi:hypothetical protein
MTTVYGLDPGPTWSALVGIDGAGIVTLAVYRENEAILRWMYSDDLVPEWPSADPGSVLVIEQVRSYGRILGNEVLDTAEWGGRFFEAWDGQRDRLPRRTVVNQLCGSVRGGDREVRAALIERWGGLLSVQKAKRGTRGGPDRPAGPLGHITWDCWSALAVAVVWRDLATLAQRAAAYERGVRV